MNRVTWTLASLLAATASAAVSAQTADSTTAQTDQRTHAESDEASKTEGAPSPTPMGHDGMPRGEMANMPMDHMDMNHDQTSQNGMAMPGMDHMANMQMGGSSPALSAEGSGTSRLPGREGGMSGLHVTSGDWMLMAHGQISLDYTDDKGPRGDDLLYSTSMLMLSAQRQFDGARLQLRSMLSLEPTMSARGYPNLFATGETADGVPLVDRQHPHDLFMELAARVDVDLSPGTSLFLYGGPVGEPALGPSAFMHRGSARYDPEPPITHHWFDSTHITYGVATAGMAAPHWQIEASAFRGREPDEDRWDIETPKLDSWSVRLSWNPTPSWSAQISHGFLKAPESTHPGENEHRTTASVHYSDGPLSAMVAFSAKDRSPGPSLTAWLAEANYDLAAHHSLFGRFENVDNDELVPDHEDPLHDRAFRISKAQLGYAWHSQIGKGPFGIALGGAAEIFGKPAALDRLYGRNLWGYTLFARLSLGH